MPANIDSYIGRIAGWHNLGTVTGKYMTAQEIFSEGGLDFQVEKRQLLGDFGVSGSGEPVILPVDAWGIFRTDNQEFLGSVGAGYEPIQHQEGFGFLDYIVGQENGAHYETAGSLGKGETVWGLIDLGLYSGIKGTHDESNNYLLFKTGHIGNYTFSFQGCRTRVVCQNTLNFALSEGTTNFTVRHTVNYKDKIEQARELVDNFRLTVKNVDDQMELLSRKVIDKDSMINVLDELFPPVNSDGERSTRSKNNIKKILALYESNDDDAIPEIRGTAYNMLNACTEYVDHYRSTKGDKRAESAMFGSGDAFKNKALQVLVKNAQSMADRASTAYVDNISSLVQM